METPLSSELAHSLAAEIEVARRRSQNDFDWFIFNIFCHSFDEFTGGQFLHDVATHISDNRYTMDVTGRDHFKSTRLYADLMWNIFKDGGNGWEAHYFSYAHDMAAYHVTKIKNMIEVNPFFATLTSHKDAESVMSYSWGDGRRMTVKPAGLTSFKRGIHADKIYVDDPLQDPANPLQPTQIIKINGIIKKELLPMVNKGGTCRIVGTPQTGEDFFFDNRMRNMFKAWITPAVVDEVNKIALWPEWKSYEDLMRIKRTQGSRIFNLEYMAMPVTTEDSYIPQRTLLPLCNRTQWKFEQHDSLDDKIVVAGFDIGKKAHPSHLAIFLKRPDSTITQGDEPVYQYTMLYSYWMDHWDYQRQIEFLNLACDFFNVERLFYDNTRGEFEGFAEQKKLHRAMQPMVLNSKSQSAMAAHFGALVERKEISFINERRLMNQILAVNNELNAISGPDGHGDSFWSCSLAVYEEGKKTLRIRSLYDDETENRWATQSPLG